MEISPPTPAELDFILATHPNLNSPFTVAELSGYRNRHPLALALMSLQYGRSTLWTITGKNNFSCYEQDLNSIELTTTESSYSLSYWNVPSHPMRFCRDEDETTFGELLLANHETSVDRYQWWLSSPWLTGGLQVDLRCQFRLLLNRIEIEGPVRVSVARGIALKYLDEIYYYRPQVPIASSIIPPLVAKHAYLSFQARALNVHPPPPVRVLERVQLNPDGTMRVPPTDSNNAEVHRQCLEEMRKDLPVLYKQVRRAVERMSLGLY